MFPNKVRIYEQMRDMEENVNNFIKQKLLNVKEEMLQNHAKVKRNVRVMAELTSLTASGNTHLINVYLEWRLSVEGRLLNGSGRRFLELFERVRIEFLGGEYPDVEWVKAKSETGANYDRLEVARTWGKRKGPCKVRLAFYLENNPRKYRLSAQLSKILGMEEDTRLRVLGAMWQYIKSNRLQDADNRELINCNQELVELFGEDKLEFHTAVFRLKDHLLEVMPIELTFEIIPKKNQTYFYDLSV